MVSPTPASVPVGRVARARVLMPRKQRRPPGKRGEPTAVSSVHSADSADSPVSVPSVTRRGAAVLLSSDIEDVNFDRAAARAYYYMHDTTSVEDDVRLPAHPREMRDEEIALAYGLGRRGHVNPKWYESDHDSLDAAHAVSAAASALPESADEDDTTAAPVHTAAPIAVPGGRSEAKTKRKPLVVPKKKAAARKPRPVVPRPAPPSHPVPAPAPRPRKGRGEALVGISAAPADYIGRPTPVSGFNVARFVQQIVNPWVCSDLQRLPDRCILPTIVTRVHANRTYTISNSSTNGTSCLFAMHSRMSQASGNPPYGPTSPFKQTATPATSAALTIGVPEYSFQPGDIAWPMQTANGSTFTALEGASTSLPLSTPWADDFGPSQYSLISYTNSYRVLSMAMRFRVVGLPSGQFMCPGKLYVAQIRCDAYDMPTTEQDFVDLERQNRAMHVSLEQVRVDGQKTVFAVPDSEEKFALSSVTLLAPGMCIPNTPGTGVPTTGYVDYFPVFGGAGPVAPLCTAIDARQFYVPYIPGTDSDLDGGGSLHVIDHAHSVSADQTMILVAGYFGTQDGVVLEVDYCKVYEAVPLGEAPAGISPAIQLPDSRALDIIYQSVAELAQVRAAAFMSRGDAGSGESLTRITGMVSDPRSLGACIRPASAESWLGFASAASSFLPDLSWMSQGQLGTSRRGVSWNFASPSGGRRHYDDDDDYPPPRRHPPPSNVLMNKKKGRGESYLLRSLGTGDPRDAVGAVATVLSSMTKPVPVGQAV